MKKSSLFLIFGGSSLIFTSVLDAQIAWQAATVSSLNTTWNSVAHGDGTYVAVSGSGRIVRSVDGGMTFSEVGNYQGVGVNFNDVEYGFNGSENVFWATGNFGSTDFLYESTDGITWTEITGSFPYPASQGGKEISVDGGGNLLYARQAPGDAFEFDGTWYSFGFGPEPDIYTSADGLSYSVAVNDYGQWVTGGIVIGSQVLPYGTVFETPGDFNTRRGAVFDFTTNPLAASGPDIIAAGVNVYVSDIDADLSLATTYYATARDSMLTSTDSGVSWSVDPLGDGVSPADMAEMAIGPDGRVAVGNNGIYYIAAIPEATSLPVLIGGLCGLAFAFRRRARRS